MQNLRFERLLLPSGLSLVMFCLTPAAASSQTIQPLKPSAPITPLPLSVENQAWLDLDIYRVLKTIINTGADLYNQQADRAGCYRLYQGSLLTLRPMLEHHPDLQKAIDNGLADASSKPSMAARAFALRAVLDEIRSHLNPNAASSRQEPPRAMPPKPASTAPSKVTTESKH